MNTGQSQLFPTEQQVTDDMSAKALQRLDHFEDCQAAIDRMFEKALKTRGLPAFTDFLRFVQKFNNLSVYNAILVNIQRPGASAVGSRKQWADFGRVVSPDAIPIVILHPFGPVRFLYDAADTEGRPLPGQEKNVMYAEGELEERQYQRTCQAAEKYGVLVEATFLYGDLLAGTAAGIDILPERLRSSKTFRYRVRVNARHDLPTRFATVSHELAHVYCGHLGAHEKGTWPDRSRLRREQMELEAEAVAWLVCQRNGVQSRSIEYLSSLITGEAIESVSLYAVFDAANRVESRTLPDANRR